MLKVSYFLQYIICFFALIILIPFLIVVSILIKIDSSGPILFSQIRIGKNKKPFYIYKFRTFKKNTKSVEKSPNSFNDSRLSRVGKYLRKYSIDELPQLFNVILFQMNLVGPRALAKSAIFDRIYGLNKKTDIGYKNIYNFYFNTRQCIKPGITGFTQIKGRSDISIIKSYEYDLYYIKNKSLMLDLKIIFKSFYIVFMSKGSN